jgi:hypothetical protein
LDVFVKEMNVVSIEGRLSKDEFVDNDPKSEIVALGSNPVPVQHLR